MRLFDGYLEFRLKDFGRYGELFQRLSREGQKPHALFIACSDSRVVPELFTRSVPGELFVLRIVGNIVPPSGKDTPSAAAAAIEYAVAELRVRDIVVCGHSHCGAMTALLQGLPHPETTPHLCNWLKLAEPVRRYLEENSAHLTEPQARIVAAAQQNVVLALDYLRTYPCVVAGLSDGSLHLHGWFFHIATAELSVYDCATQRFVAVPTEGDEV